LVNWNEQLLFDWLEENIYPDLLKAKNQMSRWDCYAPFSKHRIELKCRRTHYDTLLLEKKKYDAMIEEAAKHLDTPIYINSTPKGIYSFDLSIIDPKWEDKMLKSNTDFGNSEWIKKKVCFLKIEEAKIYK
jgi:hypothetical protein